MKRGMYSKTRLAAAELLAVAAAELAEKGRPRKRPGKPRDHADGKLTLAEAIDVSAKKLGVTRTAKIHAVNTLVSVTGLRVERIDNRLSDTREVVRILQRAAKQLVA